MNKPTPSSTYNDDEWIETSYPQQSLMVDSQLSPANGLLSDASPTASSITASKPIRRRSRASKKTPTTLLNANAKNFRALVQQFTGCPTTPMSFRNQRGPVNLNFGLKNATPLPPTPLPPTLVNPNYDYHHQEYYNQTVKPQQQQQQQQSGFQESNNQVGQDHDQCMYSFDNIISTSTDDVFQSPPTSMNPNPSMQISDGFSVENDLASLHDYGYLML